MNVEGRKWTKLKPRRFKHLRDEKILKKWKQD